MKRYKPLKRRSRVKPVNGARKAQAFARNFGPEADALRSLPCVVASHGNGKHRCSRGPIEVAHVVARGMGGVKGGRLDIVPLCAKAHRNAGEGGTMREAFELMFGVDLRAEADRLALEHERPLGMRWVADRWAASLSCPCGGTGTELIEDPPRNPKQLHALLDAGWVGCPHTLTLSRPCLCRRPLDAYELDTLRGWVTRELAREVERRFEANQRAVEVAAEVGLDVSDDMFEPEAVEYIDREIRRRHGLRWDGLANDDRWALSRHIAVLLGGPFLEDPHGEHGLARSLCEWATEGRWVS